MQLIFYVYVQQSKFNCVTSLAVDSNNVLLLTGDIEGKFTTVMYRFMCVHGLLVFFPSTMQDSCACGKLRTIASTDLEEVDHPHHVWKDHNYFGAAY